MNSQLFKIDWKDVVKGIVLAMLTAVVAWIVQALGTPGFSLSQVDWNEIGKIALTSGLGYILKNYLSDDNGRVLGQIG